MFVTKTKYNKVVLEREMARADVAVAQAKLLMLTEDWNRLVRKIKASGGSKIFDKHNAQQFTDEEVNKLIRLCHPDKHNGSQAANEMTLKLLKLRK